MIGRSGNSLARSGAALARVEAEVERLLGLFAEAGAVRVDPAALQPADVLLDLYGEDIRARAFVTGDAEGELMLRPDFTVPVVQRHMAEGAEPARYAYAGPVWRKQALGAARATEYLQCGFELFDGTDPAQADAEVFTLIAAALEGRGLTPATGDIGLLLAAIDALGTSPARKAALRRHVWRPERFHRLLERYATAGSPKAALVDAARASGNVEAMIRAAGRPVGLRGADEVAARVRLLVEDAEVPPLARSEVNLVEALLALAAPAGAALGRLRELAAEARALGPAVDRFARRLDALAARGVDVDTLPFEGSYGRTAMEYYDGFVFGFFAPDRADVPPVATGGRYDALTRVLGGASGGVPAVGGIIRPEVLLALEGAQ